MSIGSCFRVKDALDAYLARIGFTGDALPDLDTLRKLHRLHVEAVTYENLDVQLGVRLSRNPRSAFRKIVAQGRGGWCYEMNGLFAVMLEAIGFRVQRLAAGVLREKMGDEAIGNHLALIVRLDGDYLADVGLGNGLVEPVPLTEGAIRQGFKSFALERVGTGWWRFHNHAGALPPSFDFNLAVTDENLIEEKCHWMQADPASPFVCHAVIQRQFADRVESLVDRTHVVTSSHGTQSFEVASEEDYARLVRDRFELDVRDIASLWARASRGRAAELLEGRSA
jgi:N-hydroxyarylamine O-acetyltransferase